MRARWLSVLVACGLLATALGKSKTDGNESPFVVVLGVAQDAGIPQAGCDRACCLDAQRLEERLARVVCLGIVDPRSGQRWMIEATPDFPAQLAELDRLAPSGATPGLDGILITHAHMGHYTGLMHLGREVIGASEVPVHVMPRMRAFLETNGPWDQLVRLRNIVLHAMAADRAVRLNDRLTVTPFLVPHRDEYSETAGFRIDGPTTRVLFIPDIDKWDRWDRRIEDVIADVDVAYLDGTFFDDDELPGRDMSEIPHPFIIESIERFAALSAEERAKIRFIHFNHTNRAWDVTGAQAARVREAGMDVARRGERVGM